MRKKPIVNMAASVQSRLLNLSRTQGEQYNIPLPTNEPPAFTEAFAQNRDKQIQWQAFLRRNQLAAPTDFAPVCYAIRDFLLPMLRSVSTQSTVEQQWKAGGPWQSHV
jgi:hypothetical protein